MLNTNIVIGGEIHRQLMGNKRIAWHKFTDQEIAEKYTEPLENKCVQILNSHGIDPVFILNLPEYCGLSLEE